MWFRLVPVLLATLAGPAVLPAAAHADLPGRYISMREFDVAPHSAAGIGYGCERGGNAVGGGYLYGSTTDVTVDATVPSGQLGWTNQFENAGPWTQPTWTFTVCANLPTVVVRKDVPMVPAGGQLGVTTVCPSGTRPISAGWGIQYATGPSYAQLVIDTFRPVANGWYTHFHNGSGQARNAGILMRCAAVTPRVVSTSFTTRAGQGWDAIPACPSGTVSVGGGWSYAPVVGMVIDIWAPSTFNQGWRVHAYNTTAVQRSVTAYAVCV